MMNPLAQALTWISFCTSEFIFAHRHREHLPRHDVQQPTPEAGGRAARRDPDITASLGLPHLYNEIGFVDWSASSVSSWSTRASAMPVSAAPANRRRRSATTLAPSAFAVSRVLSGRH